MGRRNITRRRFLKQSGKAGLALAATSVGWGARAVHAQTKPFRIGFAVAMSGLFGKEGPLVRDSYHLWRDLVNSQGGILIKGKRYKVETLFYDDKSTPATSAKLVERLVSQDKVDLLLGTYGSSQVFAASAISEKYGYPMVSGGASSNKLFQRGFKHYFSTLGRATEEVRGAADCFTIAQPKPKTAAIIGADILFTSLSVQGFEERCKANGIEVAHKELFPVRLGDYNSMLSRIKQKNPDVLLVGSHLLVALRTARALKELDFTPKGVAFGYGPTNPDFVKSLGRDAEYIISASEWLPEMPYKGPIFGSAQDYTKMFRKAYKRTPDYLEAASTAAAVIQHLAILKTGVTPPVEDAERKALMEAMHRIDEETFYGRIRFAPDGANEAHPPLAVQIQNGKRVGVFPREITNGKLWYPMKPWKQRA
ncbi:MAG: amino acid ABC transporter substrate-binding protein [Nitrospinota bacterium]